MELQVLNSRLEKTRILNTKLAASLQRLESNGRSVQDAIGPIYGNTQKLQVLGTSEFLFGRGWVNECLWDADIDGVMNAIERIRQPSDIKSNEEDIIRKGSVLADSLGSNANGLIAPRKQAFRLS